MRWKFVLPLATILTTTACASATQVEGDWAYRQACAPEHSATMSLQQAGGTVTGTWSDGDGRGMGEAGDLTGTARDGRVYLRFCTNLSAQGKNACPDFGDEHAYLERKGDGIAWYRRAGTDYQPYLTLQRVPPGGRVERDATGCDANQDDEVITDKDGQ